MPTVAKKEKSPTHLPRSRAINTLFECFARRRTQHTNAHTHTHARPPFLFGSNLFALPSTLSNPFPLLAAGSQLSGRGRLMRNLILLERRERARDSARETRANFAPQIKPLDQESNESIVTATGTHTHRAFPSEFCAR